MKVILIFIIKKFRTIELVDKDYRLKMTSKLFYEPEDMPAFRFGV